MRIFGVILAGGAGRRMGGDKALMPLGGQPLIAWVVERFAPQVEALALSANGDPARFGFLNLAILPDEASPGLIGQASSRPALISEVSAGAAFPSRGSVDPHSTSHPSVSPASASCTSAAPVCAGRTSEGPTSKSHTSAEHTSSDPTYAYPASAVPTYEGPTSENLTTSSQDPVSQGPLSGVLAGLRWAAPLGATALVCVPCDGPFLPPDLVPRLCLASGGNRPAMAQSGDDLHPTYGLWPVSLLPALEQFLASGAVPRVRDFAFAHGAATAPFPQGSFANANTPKDLAALNARLGRGT